MFTLNCNGRLVVLDQPTVMGICNITPDSFYAGSRLQDEQVLLARAAKMIAEGATFLDIGGQSTRPGSVAVGANEELTRVIPAISAIHAAFPSAILSIDTYHALVAKEAVAAGATMVNDITGGTADPAMLDSVAALNVPYICMHMKGSPETMHQRMVYDDVLAEVVDYFSARLEACRKAGIHDVIIDPGYGFSKDSVNNFKLMQGFETLKILGRPLLAGISRKSTIYKTLGTTAEHALNGTTVLNTINLLNGADILRVHDVKEAMEAIQLVRAYRHAHLPA